MSFQSCLNCKSRVVGCHGNCPDYMREKDENEKIRTIKFRYKQSNYIACQSVIDAAYKQAKEKMRRKG